MMEMKYYTYNNKNYLVVIVGIVCLVSDVVAVHKVYPEYQNLEATQTYSHRTAFHFQPPRHWINDPNGPMYYKGWYHLFYQYNPWGSTWGNIIWAHSVSKDLINWEALDPALDASMPFDIKGVWSGSATILPNIGPVLLYTGITPDDQQVQNIAFPVNASDPLLVKWYKPSYNPIINPSPDMNISSFRDPTTAWRSMGHWKIVVGGRRKLRGMAHLYRSRDFKTWIKAKHPLHSSPNTGMWECPDFYPVSIKGKYGLDTTTTEENLKHVLKVSLDKTRFEYYTIGTYDQIRDKYTPNIGSVDGCDGLRYDYGNFYASKSFYDPKKRRRILWGWVNESRSVQDDVTTGWAGIQALPRSIWLDPNGKQLIQWPVEEVESLRGSEVEHKNLGLEIGQTIEIKGITPAQADVDVTFSLPSLEKAEPFDPKWSNPQDICGHMGSTIQGGVGPFGLLTLASRNLEEYTPVFFRVFKDQPNQHKVLLCSDASRSSMGEGLYKPSFAGFVDVDLTDKQLSLRSLIDHSVVESYGAGGKTCIVSRVYPKRAVMGEAHLFVFNNGSQSISVHRLSAWSMKKPLKMNN